MIDFLISVYDHPLAKKYIFIHAHELSGHYPRSIFDQIHDLVSSTYFQENQYGGVFGFYNCGYGHMMRKEMYEAIYFSTSMPPKMIDEDNFRPCCATFFMDANLVHTRKKAEYGLLRQRMRDYTTNKHVPVIADRNTDCSRVMEYTWHILLANRTNITGLPDSLGDTFCY
jgi:hypothetical protein